MRRITLIAALLLPVAGLHAQFRLSAEFRPRTELSHGYSTLAADNQKASLFTSQRTRLNADFKASGIQTRLSLQDVRLWGSQAQQNTNEDFGVSIHEAWAEAWFGAKLSLRLGRQELVYDNSRILGNGAWLHQGRSHDLALLKYAGAVDIHLGIAYHESGNRRNNFYTGPDAYKTMQFIWMGKSFGKLRVNLLGLNNGVPFNTVNEKGEVQSQTIRYTQTFGPYLEYVAGKFSFAGNAYYQTGTLVDGRSQSAYEYLIEGTWNSGKNLTLGGGYEELSGTPGDGSATGSTSFSTLYSTGHKFNGHMDYFYAGNHGGSVGLRNAYVKAGYKLKKISLGLDVHYFLAQAKMAADAAPGLGTEFDLYGGYKLGESVDLNIGYSRMLPTASLEILKGGSSEASQNWAWVMFTFKPVFLK